MKAKHFKIFANGKKFLLYKYSIFVWQKIYLKVTFFSPNRILSLNIKQINNIFIKNRYKAWLFEN